MLSVRRDKLGDSYSSNLSQIMKLRNGIALNQNQSNIKAVVITFADYTAWQMPVKQIMYLEIGTEHLEMLPDWKAQGGIQCRSDLKDLLKRE